MHTSPTGAPHGLQPLNQTFRATNRTGGALSQGAVVQLDLAASDGDVSDNDVGASDSGFANVIAPGAATRGRVLAVYTGTASLADDATGEFTVSGIVEALVQINAGSIASGGSLVASTSGYLDGDISAGDYVCGVALEGVTTPSTATLATVLFDGWAFGTSHS